ncbi:ankyrin repeat-containing domain protein [Aspergillus avenaceus]|uniref:Ankyrin repeat-containing domain protein n=1 Tax=Aspergillus avenaceus TaxID=36643 RepID=A0A5N6TYX7_ASPAV|nr:ankyrin repeat-containing domain protein [Aspergillus avenaceus]
MEQDDVFVEAFLDACFDGELSKVQEAIASGLLTVENLDEGLSLATDSAHPDIVAALFTAGARITDYTVDFLTGSNGKQHPSVVRHFLDNGLDANGSFSNGEPLIGLISDPACVRELLSRGADPNRCGPRGVSPLVRTIVSSRGENISCLELLLAHGAQLKSSLLFSAVGSRVPQGEPVTKFLLDKGLDPNTTDAKWGTPLHLAIHSCKPNIVKLLLDAGADPAGVSNGTEFPGETPLQVAESVEDTDLRKRLLGILRSRTA